jgi:hypothetical protein
VTEAMSAIEAIISKCLMLFKNGIPVRSFSKVVETANYSNNYKGQLIIMVHLSCDIKKPASIPRFPIRVTKPEGFHAR